MCAGCTTQQQILVKPFMLTSTESAWTMSGLEGQPWRLNGTLPSVTHQPSLTSQREGYRTRKHTPDRSTDCRHHSIYDIIPLLRCGKCTAEYCFMEFHENQTHAQTVDTRPFSRGLGTRLSCGKPHHIFLVFLVHSSTDSRNGYPPSDSNLHSSPPQPDQQHEYDRTPMSQPDQTHLSINHHNMVKLYIVCMSHPLQLTLHTVSINSTKSIYSTCSITIVQFCDPTLQVVNCWHILSSFPVHHTSSHHSPSYVH